MMIFNKLRSICMTAVIAAVLLAGSAAPASAAPQLQIVSVGNPTPITFQCYLGGQSWPIGTKVQTAGGGYWKCELRATFPGGLQAIWVAYAG